MSNVTRILVHPEQQRELYLDILTILDGGVRRDPEHWEYVTDQPATIDHWGYHTNVLSAVVFSREPNSQYYRLTIRSGEHEVFDRLRDLVVRHMTPDEEPTPQHLLLPGASDGSEEI